MCGHQCQLLCIGTDDEQEDRLIKHRDSMKVIIMHRGRDMSGLYSWVGNIVFFLIFITVVVNLLPNKKYEKYLKLFSGMVFILLVLKPLTGGLRIEDKIAYYFESITFQNESEDLKKELTGMEERRMDQMIKQYEEAVATDVEAMASDLEFVPVYTQVTIGRDQESPAFGTVTHIAMTVRRADGDKNTSDRMLLGNIPSDIEPSDIEPFDKEPSGQADSVDPIDPVEQVEQVKPVEIGGKKKPAAGREAPDESLNRLRRKVEEYYGLQTVDVEIELEE